MQNAVARARSSITPVLPKAVLASHFFLQRSQAENAGVLQVLLACPGPKHPLAQQRGCRLFKGSCLAPPGAGAGGRCSRKQHQQLGGLGDVGRCLVAEKAAESGRGWRWQRAEHPQRHVCIGSLHGDGKGESNPRA